MATPYLNTTAGRYAGPGHVRGYPGLVNTAKPIARYIPHCKTFIEPFAGLGRIADQVLANDKADTFILNDLSDYACHQMTRKYVEHCPHPGPGKLIRITKEDWLQTVKKYDGPGNVIFFDPPWSYSEYAKGAHGRAVCTMKPSLYYEFIFELLPYLKSDWFVAGNKHNTKLKKSGYPYKLIEAEKAKIMGGLIKTALISNKPFKIHK